MTTLQLLDQRPIRQDDAYATLRYDYSRIENEEDRTVVRNAALEIKPRLKRAAEDLFVIGQMLMAVKDRIAHGEWGEWVTVEFGLSERTARNWIAVARRLGAKSAKFAVLPPSALYELAAPSTDPIVVEQVEAQLDAGQVVSHADVKSLKQQQKEERAARLVAIQGRIQTWLAEQALPLDEQIATLQAISKETPDSRHAEFTTAIGVLSTEQRDESLQAVRHLLAKLRSIQQGRTVAKQAVKTLQKTLHQALALLDQEDPRTTYRQITGNDVHLHRAISSLRDALAAVDTEPVL